MRKHILKRTVAITLSLAMAIGSAIIPATNNGVHTVYAQDNIKSTSDTTSIVNDMTISSDNSMGNLLAQELDTVATQQEENDGYNVFEVEVDGITVTASLEALSECQLVVGIYSEDGTQLKAMGKCDINENSRKVQFSLDTNLMPQYFLVKAYLIDDTMSPLCSAYESTVYTQEMQEFLSKTTDDFAQDKVLNLDDDKTNNFAVYKNTVQRITSDTTHNKVVSVDDTNGIYVFENVDGTIKNLQAGDIFSCTNNGEEIIVKVSSVTVNGTKATVYSDETSLEEVFDYVKIDNSTQNSDIIVGDEPLQDGVTFEGVKDVVETQSLAEEGIATQAEVDKKYGKSLEYSFDASKSTENSKIGISGKLGFSAVGKIKVYVTLQFQQVDLTLDYSAYIDFQFVAKTSGKINLQQIVIPVCEGVKIGFTPVIVYNANLEIKANGTLTGMLGFRYGSDKGFQNISTNPKFDNKFNAEGSIYVGFQMTPWVSIITEHVAKASMPAEFGIKVSAKLDNNKGEENVSKHDCNICIAGEITGKIAVSAKVRFFESDNYTFEKSLVNKDDIKIADFYYSQTFNDGGWGKCKHYRYNITCIVLADTLEDANNVTVTVDGQNEYKTEKATVNIYLTNGELS